MPPPRRPSSTPSLGEGRGDHLTNGHQHFNRLQLVPRTSSTRSYNGEHHTARHLPKPPLESVEQRQLPKPPSELVEEIWVKQEALDKYKDQGNLLDSKVEINESYSYVQFSHQSKPSMHEYSYPNLDSIRVDRRDSDPKRYSLSHSDVITTQPPLLPTKGKKKKQDRGSKSAYKHRSLLTPRCQYCREQYEPDENEPGDCPDAPDCCARCVDAVSCMVCAKCLLYHCMSEKDGDNIHPCSCEHSSSGDDGFCRRWAGLFCLSMFVPCLWFYPPLAACRQCAINCGCCGGKHKAYT